MIPLDFPQAPDKGAFFMPKYKTERRNGYEENQLG